VLFDLLEITGPVRETAARRWFLIQFSPSQTRSSHHDISDPNAGCSPSV
jgi:hypothetical protein